jgi:Tol biopolymer transport system component/predicted Ser/Thr protein kinase
VTNTATVAGRLRPGERFGPYEIVAEIGSGAMGEVYRARDSRLRREVALKVLPESLCANPEFLVRFKEEARSASALNHPAIVTVYEVGEYKGAPFISMELIEGRSLRRMLAEEKLPLAQVIDIASQVAGGLAAAHGKGIVHRDLKPENLMITSDGRAKILDFGLAKHLHAPWAGPEDSTLGAGEIRTQPGTILGTIGYMSPEQASGHPVDFRSDQFSLGAILYEMASGQPPFLKSTPAETLAAVIRDDPAPLPATDSGTALFFEAIVERCLSKRPDDRYASTLDLAREISRLRQLASRLSGPLPTLYSPQAPPARRRSRASRVARSLGLAAAAAIAIFTGYRLARRELPEYHQLAFGRGTIWSGRFGPDQRTVIYAASWEGEPFRLFQKRADIPESVALPMPPAQILSLSSRGELAVALRYRVLPPGRLAGMLARVPMTGGEPRELSDGVEYADWSPDGTKLAIVRGSGGRSVVEYPAGRLLYSSEGWISDVRVSPAGDRVAFVEHAAPNDDGGRIVVVSDSGVKSIRGPVWVSIQGLAWGPGGGEIWIAATQGQPARALYAVNASGKTRLLSRSAGNLDLLDVALDGRALVTRENRRIGIVVSSGDGGPQRDLSLLDSSLLAGLSADGKEILLTEFGESVGSSYAVYLRHSSGGSPVKLGDGFANALSADAAFVLALLPGSSDSLQLIPTRAGEVRSIRFADLPEIQWASFFPDGRRIVVAGNRPGHALELYAGDVAGGRLAPISRGGVVLNSFQGFPVSPDAKWVAACRADGKLTVFPSSGGEGRPIPGLEEGSVPAGWSEDGRSLFVYRIDEIPGRIFRVAPAGGEKVLWKEISPADPAGIHGLPQIAVTPDGRTCAYSYARFLDDLYLVDGLR